MKECITCGPQPLANFPPYSDSPDGLRRYCRRCWNTRNREAYDPTPIRTFGYDIISIPDLRYLAGFIDGEGYVGVNRIIRREENRRIRWDARIQIVNTHRGVMDHIGQALSLTVRERPPSQPGWQIQYIVKLTGARAFAFLIVIREHLIVKRQQADLMLMMPAYGNPLNRLKRPGRNSGGRSARTDTEVAECERIWLAIKRLNRPNVKC